jgi:hypothetical protein
MTIAELIERLAAVPAGWKVEGTHSGSLHVSDPNGDRYGYVFTDGRDTRLMKSHN